MQKKVFRSTTGFFLLLVVGFYLTNLLGCKKEPEKPVEKTTEQTQTTPAPAAQTPKEVEKPKVVYPDLVGKWTGVFDSRATTLTITKQDSTEFSGKITINYREVINQQVSGKLNMAKMQINMKDLLHSRFAGTYAAKLSEDSKKLSGTFTQNVEKTKFSFSLSKK